MSDKILGDAITFDDVLLVPAYSDIVPREAVTRTRVTRNIEINIPICSAPMDTVTESDLAIALAQEGGLGFIHKNLSVEGQALEVRKVKRSANGVIEDPETLPPTETIGRAREVMAEAGISGLPVLENEKLVGILTRRDLRFETDPQRAIGEVMTRSSLVTAPVGTTLEQAEEILNRQKVEKLLLVDEEFHLRGLITIKDIDKMVQYPEASRDAHGRLRVGAAVGPDDDDRAAALVEAGADVICVDTAHGHSKHVIDAVRRLKSKLLAVDIVAGNVATAEGTKCLIEAGVDAVKVGVGPGSICTTRVIAGIGVPQITAIQDAVSVAEKAGVPVIADGGIRYSGDITKAIAAGASCVIIGGLFAGLAESPGEVVYYKGRSFKIYRGMGSLGAMVQGGRSRYRQGDVKQPDKLVPEGVEGRVPFKGDLSDFVYQLVGGLRAGMGYCGARTIEELRKRARFIRVSSSGLIESHPHDVSITQEAPNYRIDSGDGEA